MIFCNDIPINAAQDNTKLSDSQQNEITQRIEWGESSSYVVYDVNVRTKKSHEIADAANTQPIAADISQPFLVGNHPREQEEEPINENEMIVAYGIVNASSMPDKKLEVSNTDHQPVYMRLLSVQVCLCLLCPHIHTDILG